MAWGQLPAGEWGDLIPHWVETVDLLVSGTWALQEHL